MRMSIWKNYKDDMNGQLPSEKAKTLCKAEAEKGFRKTKINLFGKRVPAFACAMALVIAVSLTLSFVFGAGGIPSVKGKDAVRQAANYAELYNELNAKLNRSGHYASDGEKEYVAVPTTDNAAPKESTAGSSEGRDDYSDTNLQVAGVQEADIVKTDGDYIYAVSGAYIYIVKADNGTLTLVSKIDTNKINVNEKNEYDYIYSYARDIYVTPTRLIVLRDFSAYRYDKSDYSGAANDDGVNYDSGDKGYDTTGVEPATGTTQPVPSDASYVSEASGASYGQTEPGYIGKTEETTPTVIAPDYYYRYSYYNSGRVCADIYDITDKNNPEFITTIGQDGYAVTTRMVGGTLYLVSQHYIYGDIDKDDPRTFVPSTYKNEENSLVEPAYITLCPVYNSMTYIVVSGIDTEKGEIISTAASVGSVSAVYSNAENLYIAGYDSETLTVGNQTTYTAKTLIQRFTLDGGNVAFADSGTVNGTVLNQFSLDEYKGYLRIVTSVNSYTYTSDNAKYDGRATDVTISSVSGGQSNSVFVLNRDLEVVGKIEGLADDERVYSVRFDGDTGYFVTFRQTDPLFTVDFFDPENPKILSALKIPGFSNYLHAFDDGLLFGLGMDADEKGSVGFLKLSMFDVSDPANVSEAHKLVIDKVYYSSASYNHKAILINSEKNLIAFPTENAYMIYSYDRENGFELQKSITFSKDGGNGDKNAEYYWYYSEMRGLYIGDYMYIVMCGSNNIGGAIVSYDMCEGDYNLTASVELK